MRKSKDDSKTVLGFLRKGGLTIQNRAPATDDVSDARFRKLLAQFGVVHRLMTFTDSIVGEESKFAEFALSSFFAFWWCRTVRTGQNACNSASKPDDSADQSHCIDENNCCQRKT